MNKLLISGLMLPYLLFLFDLKFNSTIDKKLPVIIKYKDVSPQDSIKDFIFAYFKYKKIEVMTTEEARKLLLDRMQWLANNFEKFTEEIGGGSVVDKVNAYMEQPLARELSLQIFMDTVVEKDNSIDSIRWQIKNFPVKDSFFIFRSIKSEQKNSEGTFVFLKRFLDYIISAEKIVQ